MSLVAGELQNSVPALHSYAHDPYQLVPFVFEWLGFNLLLLETLVLACILYRPDSTFYLGFRCSSV